MKRYIAFLRGINVGGKKKVPMMDLKENFEELGFIDVKTYLNSGNVIFSSNEDNIEKLIILIEEMLKNKFGFHIPIYIISKENLEEVLLNSPKWWGNDDKEIYDNLIFIIPPATFSDVFNEIGEAKTDLENIQNYKDVIFWSFIKKDYRKTNWWSRTSSAKISNKLTIRTANTVRKIVEM